MAKLRKKNVPSDLEIAQKHKMKHIRDIAKKANGFEEHPVCHLQHLIGFSERQSKRIIPSPDFENLSESHHGTHLIEKIRATGMAKKTRMT